MILGRRIPEKPRNLPEWLDVATRDLVPPAPARIRAEIGAHYAEAVQAHQARGTPEPEAQAAALAELGSARAAAWRFGQEHLTTGEVETVFRLVGGQICLGVFLAVCNGLDVFLPDPVGPKFGLLSFLAAVFICLASGGLLRRSRRVVSRCMVSLLLSLLWLNFGGFLWMTHIDKADDQVVRGLWELMAVGLILVVAGRSLTLLRLRRKLAVEFDGDLPSDKGTTN
jgi:hypothetical protein